MAEAFGIAAGVAGFLSLADQLRKIIKSLDDIRAAAKEAPAKLNDLTQQVQLLVTVVEQVNVHVSNCSRDSNPIEQVVQDRCNEDILNLQQLERMLQRKLEAKLQRKMPKIVTFRYWRDDLDNLEHCIKTTESRLVL